TQRDGHTHAVWDGLPYRRVTGLDTAESTALLEVTAGHLAPAVAGRLAERAGGNPLALTEVSAMLTPGQAHGSDPLPDPLPIGEQVEQLFASRLEALDDQALMLVLLAAAEEQGELDIPERAAAELGLGLHALQPAERHGLLRADGRHVRFRHPLARSAAYYHQPVAQRRGARQARATALLPVGAGLRGVPPAPPRTRGGTVPRSGAPAPPQDHSRRGRLECRQSPPCAGIGRSARRARAKRVASGTSSRQAALRR